MTKKTINHVYLDLDGVISNFDLETAEQRQDDKEWKEKGFPTFIKMRGFEILPLMDDAPLLLRFLKTTGVPVTILTSAGKTWGKDYDSVKEQKQLWLDKQGIDWPMIVVHQKEDKKNYATETCLLIDDTKFNCKDFKNAGGYAIHHKTAIETIVKANEKYNFKRG